MTSHVTKDIGSEHCPWCSNMLGKMKTTVTNAQTIPRRKITAQYDEKNLVRWSSAAVIMIFSCIGIINSLNGNYSTNGFEMLRALQEEPYTFELTHKKAFPLSSNDKLGFFCATIGLMVAAGGGIGGGGILVPIYILVMNFAPKHAIPLSNVTIFGGAIANNLLNARKRHPFADRPLIDWDLILIMEPLTIGGALMGAFLNKLLPETLLVTMLIILLTFTAYNTLKKAIRLHAKESVQKIKNKSALTTIMSDEENEFEDEADDTLLSNSEEVEMIKNMSEDIDEEKSIDDVPLGFNRQKELQDVLEDESKTPLNKVNALVFMFLVILFLNLMKGGGAFPSPVGIKCGSSLFWMANGFMLGWLFLVSMVARAHLINRYKYKQKIGYSYVDGDIEWDERATIFYPAICCLAGFAAGMFGVGGGIIKGPLMLAMGVHPQVSSASSACMILFTSFTATTSFFVFGLLDLDYAIICVIMGFLATLAGQIALAFFMAKHERSSYIAFSIGGVVLLSALLMTIESLVSVAEKTDGKHGSGGICGEQY